MFEQPVNIFERLEVNEARQQARRSRIQEWALIIPVSLVLATIGVEVVRDFSGLLELANWLEGVITTRRLLRLPQPASQALNTYLLISPTIAFLFLIPHRGLRIAVLIAPLIVLLALSACYVLRCVIEIGAMNTLGLGLWCSIGLASVAASYRLARLPRRNKFSPVGYLAFNLVAVLIPGLAFIAVPKIYHAEANKQFATIAARAVLGAPSAHGARLIVIKTDLSRREACGWLDFGGKDGAAPFLLGDDPDPALRFIEVMPATRTELEQNLRFAVFRQSVIDECQESGSRFVASPLE